MRIKALTCGQASCLVCGDSRQPDRAFQKKPQRKRLMKERMLREGSSMGVELSGWRF